MQLINVSYQSRYLNAWQRIGSHTAAVAVLNCGLCVVLRKKKSGKNIQSIFVRRLIAMGIDYKAISLANLYASQYSRVNLIIFVS